METYNRSLSSRFERALAQRENELRAILRLTGDLADAAPEREPRDVSDFKDAASEQTLATVTEAQAQHATQELEQVLTARQRLQEQAYGHCLDCGEAIDLRRLAALPATPYCTSCQAIHEHALPVPPRR
jgi:DnaK suppressor protein